METSALYRCLCFERALAEVLSSSSWPIIYVHQKCLFRSKESVYYYNYGYVYSIQVSKNEVGCRDETVPKAVDTRRHRR